PRRRRRACSARREPASAAGGRRRAGTGSWSSRARRPPRPGVRRGSARGGRGTRTSGAPHRLWPTRRSDPTLLRKGAGSVSSLLRSRSEEHTSELQSRENLVCRLLLEKKNIIQYKIYV